MKEISKTLVSPVTFSGKDITWLRKIFWFSPFQAFSAFFFKLARVLQALALHVLTAIGQFLRCCLFPNMLQLHLVFDFVLHFLHEVVVRGLVPWLIALLCVGAQVVLAMEIYLLVDVFDWCQSRHHADAEVLIPVAVIREVVDSLAFPIRHFFLTAPTPLLHLWSHTYHQHSTCHNQQKHQQYAWAHRRPWDVTGSLRCTFWKQELAVASSITRHTGTNIAVVTLMACGAVVARVVLATADRWGTVSSCVTRWASACVAVGTLLAGTTVLAGEQRALIADTVTVHPGETLRTLAQVWVH